MAREKVVVATLANVGTQVDDLTIPVGGSSLSGTESSIPNPMVGDRLWNSVACAANVAAIGGSWSIEVQGTVAGIAGLPLARVVSLGAPDGLAGNFALTNLCGSGSMPTPTHVLFDETAAGGITATVNVVAKTYRGSLSSGPSNSFRVVEGILFTSAALTADTTIDMSANPPSGGTFASFMGLDKYSLWDACNFYVQSTSVTGTWLVDIIGVIGGVTVSLATSPTIGGATKCALVNNFRGPVPKPSGIIFTEVTAGGASFSVCAIAKAHRGQRHKI